MNKLNTKILVIYLSGGILLSALLNGCTAKPQQDTSQTKAQQIQALIDKGDFEKAESESRTALQNEPANDNFRMTLATAIIGQAGLKFKDIAYLMDGVKNYKLRTEDLNLKNFTQGSTEFATQTLEMAKAQALVESFMFTWNQIPQLNQNQLKKVNQALDVLIQSDLPSHRSFHALLSIYILRGLSTDAVEFYKKIEKGAVEKNLKFCASDFQHAQKWTVNFLNLTLNVLDDFSILHEQRKDEFKFYQLKVYEYRNLVSQFNASQFAQEGLDEVCL